MFLHPYKTPRTTEDAADEQERAIDRMSKREAANLEFMIQRFDDIAEWMKKAKRSLDEGHVGSCLGHLRLAAQEINATDNLIKL